MNTFNTGRVRIGLCYIRPAMPIQGDAVILQTALLDKRSARPLRAWQRLLGGIWSWL